MSISNLRALQIETALANCMIRKLEESSSAKCLLPFLVDGEFLCFHFDNVDKCIDTQDGQNQLHGLSCFKLMWKKERFSQSDMMLI